MTLGSLRRSRGQATVLGYTLLLGMAFLGITSVLVLGGLALEEMQHSAEMSRAQHAFTVLDSRGSQVALGGSELQTLDLGLDLGSSGASLESRQTGWMRVVYIDTSTGARTVVLNETLGSIVYTNGDASVAYQGGGVWRHQDDGTVMVSAPEFHYRDGTVTLPITTIENSGTLNNHITVRSQGASVQKFPNATVNNNFTNPLVEKKVEVTVQSQYYEGWGTYFQERTDGGVRYDHSDEEVTVTLLNPPETRKVTDALLVVGGGGGLFQIQSGQNSVVDSYNSSTVPPSLGPNSPPSSGGTADVTTDKDIQYQGNAQITGNLTTTGRIFDWSGSPGPPYRVGGNLRYGEGSVSSSDCNDYVGGWCAKNAPDTVGPDPIDGEVQNTIRELNSSNDNTAESCFSESAGVEFGGGCGNTVELGAGNYYTDQNLQVQGNQKLILNTTQGNIRIAVDEAQNIQFQNGGNVTVVGNGTVRIYGTKQYQIQGGNTKVWNRGWDAPQLWLFCTAECQVQIKSSATFVGVVYAPSTQGASNAQVQIDGGQTEVYGAIVGGGDAQLQSQADIHFDDALRSMRVFPESTLPTISYLHISINRQEISSD